MDHPCLKCTVQAFVAQLSSTLCLTRCHPGPSTLAASVISWQGYNSTISRRQKASVFASSSATFTSAPVYPRLRAVTFHTGETGFDASQLTPDPSDPSQHELDAFCADCADHGESIVTLGYRTLEIAPAARAIAHAIAASGERSRRTRQRLRAQPFPRGFAPAIAHQAFSRIERFSFWPRQSWLRLHHRTRSSIVHHRFPDEKAPIQYLSPLCSTSLDATIRPVYDLPECQPR